MKRPKTHIWAIGLDEHGTPTICGSYDSREYAEDATSHLTSVKFYPMTSGNRAQVMPQLRRIIKSSHFRKQQSPAPIEPSEKRNIMARIFHRKQEEDLD